MSKTSDRINKAAAGIEADVVSLTERLKTSGDIDADLRHLEALLFAAVEPIDVQTLRDRMPEDTDVGALLARRKLSNAALETLAIVAYHQPVTRAEIEDVRGVAVSKGTLDVLMELGWLRLRGRRRTPGRPVTYGTTNGFLAHFNLESITDLPGRDDLKAAGLLDPRLPKDFEMPEPMMVDDLTVDEDPLEEEADPEFFEDFLTDDEDDS